MMTWLTQHRPHILAALVSGTSLVSALSLGLLAPPATVQAKAASAEHGRRLFVQSCSHCHGNDARGNGEDGDGPDLSRLAIGNARIASIIQTGIPEEMPSFAKKHGPADRADLTAYLRTLH